MKTLSKQHWYIPVTSLSMLLVVIALGGCGNESPRISEQAVAASSTTPGATDWSAYPLDLFSESLHDIAMPEAGWARVEIFNQVLEGELLSDCSAPTEAPPQTNDWTDHRFQVDFQVQMDDRYANVGLLRTVIPEQYETRPPAPVESENVHIRTISRSGQTLDVRGHGLRRNQADEAPLISVSPQQRPEPATSLDQVPMVRVHPDGRRATFVGSLARREHVDGSEYDDFEEVRIAVHCGPG